MDSHRHLTVLLGGLSTAFMLFVRSKLWPGKKSTAFAGMTDERFALVIARKDQELPISELPALLHRHGAVEVWQEAQK